MAEKESIVWEVPPDDHMILNLVGRVALEWSHLESMLDSSIYRLADLTDHQGACITAQLMGVWPRINSIKALLTFHLPKVPEFASTISTLNKFGSDCQAPSEDRNRAIHDPWWSSIEDSRRVAQSRSMPKNKLIHGLEEIDPNKIVSLTVKIHYLWERAIDLFAEIDRKLPPWPGRTLPVP